MSFSTQAVPQALFIGRSLNFQSTADQALANQGGFTNYVVTDVVGVRRTGGATITCAGGIYPSTSKAGTPVVAAVQSWIAMTGALGIVPATAAALPVAQSSATLYLSLTTGSTGAVTGDVFVYGIVVD